MKSLLQHTLIEKYKCSSCGHMNEISFDQFYMILSTAEKSKPTNPFELMSKTYEMNDYRVCDDCNKFGLCSISTFLKKKPKLLLIHVNRYSEKKLNDTSIFPILVNSLNCDVDKIEFNYVLKAQIVYDVTRSHYFAECPHNNNP